MKVACYGSMTRILISHLVSRPDRQSSRKITTQCPGITNQQCPGITNKQCPGITNKQWPRNNNTNNRSDVSERAPLDIIPSASWFNSNLPASNIPAPRSSVCNPVPRTTLQRDNETTQVRDTEISSSLPLREKGIGNTEGKGVRKSEKKRVRHLFMMRAGPVSAQETHPVPAFQHK